MRAFISIGSVARSKQCSPIGHPNPARARRSQARTDTEVDLLVSLNHEKLSFGQHLRGKVQTATYAGLKRSSGRIVGNSEVMAEVALGPGKRRNRKLTHDQDAGLPGFRPARILGAIGGWLRMGGLGDDEGDVVVGGEMADVGGEGVGGGVRGVGTGAGGGVQ